jgi:cytochrome c biogenesis protein CcmG/thiol:disulfide interchange protein DsbE
MMSLLTRPSALFAALLSLSASLALGALPKVGEALPDFAKFKLDLPEFKGRVVFLDLFAAWCAPCKKAFPVLREMHEKLSPRGLLIVGVSVDEEKSAMDGFLKENPVPFRTVHDPEAKIAEALGVEKMPTSILIGPDGKVVAVFEGFSGEEKRKLYFEKTEEALKAAGR